MSHWTSRAPTKQTATAPENTVWALGRSRPSKDRPFKKRNKKISRVK
jgi:hypothetical protein